MLVLAVFLFVYAGMMLGNFPGLALDRTGIAIVGAIALVVGGVMTPAHAWNQIDVNTMAVLFGLMLISAQLRLGGFYTAVTRRFGRAAVGPWALMALLVAVAGLLSALLSNDIVCLAAAPVVLEITYRRNLNPVPYLLALALAANTGSAATLIGNPQNILVGEHFHLSFARYLVDGGVPALLGLVLVWVFVIVVWREHLHGWPAGKESRTGPMPEPSRWHTVKGLAVLAIVVLFFLAGSPPRAVVALGAGAILLVNRKLTSRRLFGLVDWDLLLLFIGLFVVTHALVATGLAARGVHLLASWGLPLGEPLGLATVTLISSNVFSNVPAVMLLLPGVAGNGAAVILALVSTFAGNLLLVGSIANIIVASAASTSGITISWRDHARVGIPLTIALCALAVAWLALIGVI
ncbi:MAG: anion transporter [Acidobacteria bacterium]|nr:anion transporter [Acidobacteriota bacterium]